MKCSKMLGGLGLEESIPLRQVGLRGCGIPELQESVQARATGACPPPLPCRTWMPADMNE